MGAQFLERTKVGRWMAGPGDRIIKVTGEWEYPKRREKN